MFNFTLKLTPVQHIDFILMVANRLAVLAERFADSVELEMYTAAKHDQDEITRVIEMAKQAGIPTADDDVFAVKGYAEALSRYQMLINDDLIKV